MALAVVIDGKGVIANADALTNDTGGTGTGDWGENGGGSISLTNDVRLFGTSCIAGAYSNKSGEQYFDIGAGNELNFNAGGNEYGQHLFMWIHCPTIGLLQNKANKGLAIRLGTGLASNYRDYVIAGSDDSNGWNGEWKCFVIDPTKTGTGADNGTYNPASIRYIGVWIDAAGLAKGDNIFIDQMAVGFGLRITGTSTQGWKDAVDYCTAYANRAWGMLQQKEGIYYAYGRMKIGYTGQGAATDFADQGRILKFGTCQFWNGSSWVSTIAAAASGIVMEDAASYATAFTDGVQAGSDNGRAGSTFLGNADLNVYLDLYGGANAGSLTRLFGTKISDFKGTLSWGNDPDHLFYGGVITKSSQFDPVGAPVIRNCIFSETLSANAALLWNSNANIRNCQFIANTAGAGIQHAAAGDFNYYSMVFSGCTYDILNSSAGTVNILCDENSSPSTHTETGGGTTNISSPTILTITIVDADGAAITDPCEVTIVRNSDAVVLWHEESVIDGDSVYNYSSGGGTVVYINVHNVTGYQSKTINNYTLPSGGSDNELTVQLDDDPFYANP
jgi:hypothetical protein